jgi:hypothetical protein
MARLSVIHVRVRPRLTLSEPNGAGLLTPSRQLGDFNVDLKIPKALVGTGLNLNTLSKLAQMVFERGS